jgi:imidazolonepropionase-like amidohydrolase
VRTDALPCERATSARCRRISALSWWVLSVGATVPAAAAAPAPPLIIEHVTVLSMTPNSQPLRDATVVIRDGKIASIGSARAARPPGAKRINGSGKWLMPGLTDMHVHLDNEGFRRFPAPTRERPLGSHPREEAVPYVQPEDVFTPYLFNGVLQVFELQALSESIGQRVEVESGRVLGPRISLAAMIDGSPSVWPVGSTRVATTAEGGRQAVRDAAAEGYDAIKAYSMLDLDTFTAIVDEARKLNMRVVGHIPQRGKGITEKFFQPGYDLVAHAEEFAQQPTRPAPDSIPHYVEMAKRNGTWLIATLTTDERIFEQLHDPDSLQRRPELLHLNPGKYWGLIHDNTYLKRREPRFTRYMEEIVAFNRQLVPAFVAARIPVLVGTDSGIPGVVPGFSLHDELESLARAGMSNLQILEAATRLPSEWLRVTDQRGTVETGKQADLLLLDADPLQDVANTRKIAGIVIRGQYLSRVLLDRRLKEMDARYAALRAELEKSH